ncbi:MAG TPA: zinc ribbon domain-containing protein [Deltaproteobacteria bacterium]|uniref:Zinc ribbon domain-containing protein n=1 Tax=Candidatus Desulfacyla euxinica TaxID=2841693 RepID=A0A8J6MZP3_9DELT|nr:zinc ribbon domain-containing protein [Candidatus Desulfacyla euxinica]MBL7217608.1 zinc ribbon domain-containing protein [Desulfobacteraceae bacterium]HIJ58903.1 zinc ribbon domain-containing protein [Deltaproteobacteria bacterium]
MPIYEYECDKCGNHLEALQKYSDAPITECGECHSNKLKKLISHSTFHLKGTGWYVTDYASKSGSNNNEGKEKGTSSKEGKEKGTSGNTEKTKPEKKAKSATESSSKKDTPAPSKSKE